MKKWQRLKQLSEAGKIGGQARAKLLSPERRREIASNAAKVRWGKKKYQRLFRHSVEYATGKRNDVPKFAPSTLPIKSI